MADKQRTSAVRQLPLGIRLRDSSHFSSYFAGPNKQVVNALRSLRIGVPPTSVWIHGGRTLGKTHLLQGLCAEVSTRGETSVYLPLSELKSLGADVLSGCGGVSWVCVDDSDCVLGNLSWETALFALFHELEEHGGHLICAAAAPPRALPFQLRDLSSRVAGGLVLKLQSLTEAEQLSALQLRASHRGLELPEETASYLLRRLPRQMAALCDFLDTLDVESLAAQRRLTVPFVREVLDRVSAKQSVGINK